MHRFAGPFAAGRRRSEEGSSSIGGAERRSGAMELRDNVETGETENQRELFYMSIPEEAPLKREQEKLSGVVKNVHRKLRRKYREGKKQAPLGLCGPAASQGPSGSPCPCGPTEN